MTITENDAVVIRLAGARDIAAVRRLAALDSSAVPAGELLIAEVDGEVRAALRITDRAYVADPFRPTRELVALLDLQAARLRRDAMSRGDRVRARLSQWSDLWWRAGQVRPSV